MERRKFVSTSALLLAALIWGFAFVTQDNAAEKVDTFTLNAIRFIIGAFVLAPVIVVLAKVKNRPVFEKTKKDRKMLIKAGIFCGLFLSVAANIQQFGIALYPDNANTSGRSGFITALYILIVPIIGLFFHKKVGLHIWFCVALAIVGLYVLCLSNGIGSVYLGDVVILMCAVAFSFQIICIDYYGEYVNGLKLSCIQFLVCGIISLILMFIFEKPDISSILSVWKDILYLAVMSSGVAYTLQIIGQQYSTSPTVSSIVMSLESVFAAVGGVMFSGEHFSTREIVGCLIMFTAIIIAQLPVEKLHRKKQ